MNTNLCAILAMLVLAPVMGLAQNINLIATFTNPVSHFTYFGFSAAAVGSDKVLIGAFQDTHTNSAGKKSMGAAYLFNTNAVLLTTFTSPAVTNSYYFGYSVTKIGADSVLIGDWGDRTDGYRGGAAYLFSTNGTLLRTFRDPTPMGNEEFGFSVAAFGSDRLLIGAPFNMTSNYIMAGAAYLFNTNGTLLATFTNPTPSFVEYFGMAVAQLGDRVLIGAPFDNTAGPQTGAVHLFSTNGVLLNTFTNPTPETADYFGLRVAAVGNDLVLIGAYADDAGAASAGAAYLFNVSGTLLMTLTNPTPQTTEYFGISLAAIGSDRMLIGAYGDNAVAASAGAAYLYSTNGNLLATITDPPARAGDQFGFSLAALDSSHVLICAKANRAAGYLFVIPEPSPSLSIQLTSTNTVAVVWPSPSAGFALQQNTNGVANGSWSNVTANIQNIGTNRVLIINPPNGERYYRLIKL